MPIRIGPPPCCAGLANSPLSPSSPTAVAAEGAAAGQTPLASSAGIHRARPFRRQPRRRREPRRVQRRRHRGPRIHQELMQEAGLEVRVDTAGNIVGRREGSDPSCLRS